MGAQVGQGNAHLSITGQKAGVWEGGGLGPDWVSPNLRTGWSPFPPQRPTLCFADKRLFSRLPSVPTRAKSNHKPSAGLSQGQP